MVTHPTGSTDACSPKSSKLKACQCTIKGPLCGFDVQVLTCSDMLGKGRDRIPSWDPAYPSRADFTDDTVNERTFLPGLSDILLIIRHDDHLTPRHIIYAAIFQYAFDVQK